MRFLNCQKDRSGWVLGETGVWRRETIHSMLRRLPGWDYRGRAIYQITLVLADRASAALGRLEVRRKGGDAAGWASVGAAKGLEPDAVEARVVASEFGLAVEACWREIAAQWPGVSLLGHQLMPDHFHGLVFVERPQAKTLGNIIGRFKSRSTSRVRQLLAACGQEPNPASLGASGGVGVSGGVGAAGAAGGAGAFGSPSRATGFQLWAPGFQDTILFREGQLANMKRYLADNPRRLAVKRLFPDLFRVVGLLGVDLYLGPGDAAAARGWFMAIGNRFLLGRPLAQVQVSRRDFGYRRERRARSHASENRTGPHASENRTGGLKICRDARGEPIVDYSTPLYAERKAALFAAAKHGAVLLSPCVSDGERQIAREALAAGLPLVTLHNKGFSKLQKPAGRYFDACSEGRLLMLAPAAWPYVPGEKVMTRFDATAMNRLSQWIAGVGAAEINYHGMKPANIDALARAAAKVETLCSSAPLR